MLLFLRSISRGCLVIGALSADPSKFTKDYCGLFTESGLMPKKKLIRCPVSENALIQPGTPLVAGHFQVGQYIDIIGRRCVACSDLFYCKKPHKQWWNQIINVTFTKGYLWKNARYYKHCIHVTLSLVQFDHIKWLLLHTVLRINIWVVTFE